MDDKNSRLANCHNIWQGKFKRVLCVCSAGLLRSPTAAYVLSQEPFNFNTRSAGLNKKYALILVDDVLLEWADEIVCMDEKQAKALRARTKKPILCLDIDDGFSYRNLELVELVKEQYIGKSNWKVNDTER